MLWIFVALQAMTPFIHAHAGAVQLSHGGFMHVHQNVHGDAAYHAVASSEHGEEVTVAHGVPPRSGALKAQGAAPLMVSVTMPSLVDMATCPGTGLVAPPPLLLVRPDHTLPHALAPPAA